MARKEQFEPVIVAFCCWWCAYGAADLAGTSKLDYPTNVRIIRVPCSGRVEPQFILRAFQNKADGVIVAGCLEGGCHYVDGNVKAKKRIESLKKALDAIGLSGDRLEFYLMSSAMSDKFIETMTEFTARIRRLGESPLRMWKK